MSIERTRIGGLDLREWDIVSGLLHMISSFGGRRGCDDFHFARYVPEVERRRDVEQRFHTYNGDPEEYDPAGDYSFEHAWVLAAFYREQTPAPEKLKQWEYRLIAAVLRHGFTNFAWQGTPLAQELADLMRQVANLLWTEDPAILAQE